VPLPRPALRSAPPPTVSDDAAVGEDAPDPVPIAKTAVPEVPAVLRFIQERAGQDDREAYSTLNMGAGFALFVAPGDAQRTVEIARSLGIAATLAGSVEAGDKQVLIEPLGIRFSDEDLQLR